MKKYIFKSVFVLIIMNQISCGNSQQDSQKDSKIDTTSNQSLTKKTNSMTQKITPCFGLIKMLKQL
jgi:hypothetical protein